MRLVSAPTPSKCKTTPQDNGRTLVPLERPDCDCSPATDPPQQCRTASSETHHRLRCRFLAELPNQSQSKSAETLCLSSTVGALTAPR